MPCNLRNKLFASARGIVAGAVMAIAPGIVHADFNAPFGMRVNPVDANVFETVSRGAASGREYWCAASDYARRALGASWQAKIYIARTRGPSVTTNKKSAVQFTLNPQAAGVAPAAPSISLNALREGDSMSVQQAHSYCQLPSGRFRRPRR